MVGVAVVVHKLFYNVQYIYKALLRPQNLIEPYKAVCVLPTLAYTTHSFIMYTKSQTIV